MAENKENSYMPALEIHVTEKLPFDSIMGSKLMTTTGLCKLVNQVFSKVYIDYIGSTIDLTQVGDVNTHLYFTKPQGVNPDDQRVYAFEAIDAAAGVTGANILQKLDAINSRSKQQAYVDRRRSGRYKLTEYGRDGLARFFGLGKKNENQYKEPNWADPNYLGERPSSNGLYQAPTVVVSGIDIKEILKELYGDVDEFGGKIYYEVIPTNRIFTQNQGISFGNPAMPQAAPNPAQVVQTMLMNVMCARETMVNELLQEAGVNMGYTNIVRS